MRVFISHSRHDKPLVREVLAYLPLPVRCWLDEEQLLFGDRLKPSLRKAVEAESDLVLLFLSSTSVSSEWVRREVKWALARERSADDPIVLPILLDDVLGQVRPRSLRERLCLECFKRTRRAIKGLAEEISQQLRLWQERRAVASGEPGADNQLSLSGTWKTRFTWEPQDASDPGRSDDMITVRHKDGEILGEVEQGQFDYVFRGRIGMTTSSVSGKDRGSPCLAYFSSRSMLIPATGPPVSGSAREHARRIMERGNGGGRKLNNRTPGGKRPRPDESDSDSDAPLCGSGRRARGARAARGPGVVIDRRAVRGPPVPAATGRICNDCCGH